MTAALQPHPISEAAQAADAAYTRYADLAREGLHLWRTRAPQDVRDANRAEKEAARLEWRRLVGLAGSGS
ncbi:hypothetical protein DKM44_02160 [Deinococcus irradiatisoli]|uniref:Bacterial transcriptional activator domain-containing protein n=1 Tax=Deinococcus irradiatisoli TaxID=2202254 RepID=A0A2Z3JAP3_9DEIO|nr:BTAD domain-containing putative transcriptional regulator [Deinococcus irradiatisoli]AWN22183.1 hypothetical protein DKM44_02160 [Deinococcus irradiatisoli]